MMSGALGGRVRRRLSTRTDVRVLQNTIFMLQRLVLRHEDVLAALRPELNFVMFARADVAATVVPAILEQTVWQEDKAQKPETLDRPMRSCLLSCVFRELGSRVEALMTDNQQQTKLVKMGWTGASPVVWHYLKCDAVAGCLKPDTTNARQASMKRLPPLLPP